MRPVQQELQQTHHELQRSQQQVHRLQEQVSYIIQNSETTGYTCALPSQLAAMSSESKEEQPHWVMGGEEVVMTSEGGGRGEQRSMMCSIVVDSLPSTYNVQVSIIIESSFSANSFKYFHHYPSYI